MARGRSTIAAVFVFLVSSSTAFALYTPNPAGRWAPGRFFLAGDFEFDGSKDLNHGGSIDNIVGFYARPAFSVAKHVMIYGRFGFRDSDSTDAGAAVGFGVQGAYVLPRAQEWAIGGAFDFLYWDADLSPRGPNIQWKEFQFSPAVSYNIPRYTQLTPYGGLAFDFVDARGSTKEDKPVGMLFGINFDPTNVVRLDAQVRVINETGFFFSGGYLF